MLATLRRKKSILYRWLFVGLSTVITVFFSEKAYAYVQGYAYAELLLYYAFPVYACLWAIDHFRVRRLPGVVLVSALYAFLVEGVLTTVLYEAGLFDPVMPAYFVGWHGLFSFVFGWYMLRRWLLRGRWRRILGAAFLFGLFWGVWSLTYWVPETLQEWGHPARWPVRDFALYALLFTLTLALSHWLLGRGAWLPAFKPGKIEGGFVALVLVALFAVGVLPVLPLALLKLAALLGTLFLVLRTGWPSEPAGTHETLFSEMAGPVQGLHALALLAIPVAATGVYALATLGRLSADGIPRLLLEIMPFLQALVGAGLFFGAIFAILWQRKDRLEG